jgi:2-succinyl-5-enolpyruvyl-6-hydroxy-3-cyclohexene-1-carboxylate synthase
VDGTNRNTALASAFVEELARCGIEHACVSPGSRSAPLALAFWHQPEIRVWSQIDERCAGFFAVGLAQQTGKPVAVLTTSGTAGANLHPAVAEAGEARVPLIVITADRPPELRGRGAGQTIDQIKLYGSAVRWFCELGVHDADDAGLLHFRSIAVRAVAEAVAAPPGPVHLNVPLREPLAPVAIDGDVSARDPLALEGRADRRPLTTVRQERAMPDKGLIDEVARLITEHPCGLIIAGRQRDPALAGPVAAFAKAAGYPILAEPTSQLRAGGHERELVVPHYDALLREPAEDLDPEVVIRVGDMVTSKAVREWLGSNRGCTQLVIDPDGAWNEPTSTASELIRVAPGPLCDALASILEPRRSEWSERWIAASRTSAAAIGEFLDGLDDELFEPHVYRELALALPADSTVYVASSMPVRDLETFFPTIPTPVRFLANRGANGIDGLVSSGLGAAAAAPGRAFLLVGDVGLYHDMNGLLAARRLGVEATIVVLNNGGGAIFDFLPIADYAQGYEELFATPTGLDLGIVAALFDLPFVRVSSHSELRAALSGPGLVDVPLERKRNVELHRKLIGRVANALKGQVSSLRLPDRCRPPRPLV